MLTPMTLLNSATITPDGCWEWNGYINESGYGRTYDPETRKNVYIHRYAYTKFVGPISTGYEIDHTCRNTVCFCPEHLEVVTKRVNLLRRVKSGQSIAHYTSRMINVMRSVARR